MSSLCVSSLISPITTRDGVRASLNPALTTCCLTHGTWSLSLFICVCYCLLTYLLLLYSVTKNLPYRSQSMNPKECFETFISAVFYVGKGKRSRPYSHLYEALQYFRGDKTAKVRSVYYFLYSRDFTKFEMHASIHQCTYYIIL